MTLLDTPGHVDFSAEMERTLQVLDYAVLIVSGLMGCRDIRNALETFKTIPDPGVYLCE